MIQIHGQSARPLSLASLAVLLLLGSIACETTETFEYPVARASEQVDVFHGVEVRDPYRWLEDSDSKETRAWIEAQNTLTDSILDSIPQRARIRERLAELWDYERYSIPVRRAGHTIYSRNDGLQDQSVLYIAGLDGGADRPLLDPNTFSEDGTIALAGYTPSWDGRFLAYATSDGGSDWRMWHVLEIESGRLLDDLITGNKFGGVEWNGASDGLFYMRYDKVEEGQELVAKNSTPDIYSHRLGTAEAEDTLILARAEDPSTSQGFSLSEDRQSLVVSRWQASSRMNELHLLSLGGGASLRPLIEGFDARYYYIGDDGSTMWIQTDLDSPKGRLVTLDMTAPAREDWNSVVPENEDAIQDVSLVGQRLIVTYMDNATSRIRLFNTKGEPQGEVELPGIGTARGFDGEIGDTETFFSFTSFTFPTAIYRYSIDTGRSEVYRQPKVDFDPDLYETYQVFYKSLDGHTDIPMFLTHKKDIVLESKNPTYLYGYGGFNVSLTPFFSVPNLVWIEMGGILAIPNLRGGGEFGEEWHAAGTKRKKQNVFDDFEAAARHLVRWEYTTPGKIAIGGGSNGGLLVGASITQNPRLFGAALPAVGVMDMLRYHLFTIGWAWAGDYGTVENENEFHSLLEYSPVHNVRKTEYPATLITTADHDDRVVPAHSFKFAAALQAGQIGSDPVLIRIDTRAGHGAGKPTSKRIEEAADRWAFVYSELDLDYFELRDFVEATGHDPSERREPVFF